MQPAALYLHIPFCRSKCAYCDFDSYAGCTPLFGPYLAALRQELERIVLRGAAHALDRSFAPAFRTLYVGGGTPTVLPPADLAALIEDLRRAAALPAGAEVTVEANPGTVDQASLHDLRRSGVSRLSLGVQSFDDRLLRLLGRIHSAGEAVQAVRDARAAGFDNLNLDLMLGLPRQGLQEWQESVERALDLVPEHLSLYALTVEEGTPLAERIERGVLPAPDDDLAAGMYEWAEERLAQAGYAHYEISNWARPGHACQHNLVYWRNEPYVGLGAGAHSWWGHVRRANLRAPQAYIEALAGGRLPVAEEEAIGQRLEMAETVMMGLRLLEEGVSLARFEARFGVSMEAVYGTQIAALVGRGLLEYAPPAGAPERVRLAQAGHLLGNQVFVEFLEG